MPAKFKIGDYVRAGGMHRPMPACYPWLKRGQIMRIIGIAGHSPSGEHLEYQFAARRAKPGVRLASYDLRHIDERLHAPGAGRPRRKQA